MQAAQRSPEWFSERLGRATASHFHDIMLGPAKAGYKNYRAQLVVERITGQPLPQITTAAMQWGIDTEPLARLRYTLATGNHVEECGFFKHTKLMAGASPDGLVGKDGTVEIKCPNTATHIQTLRFQAVPARYVWQVIGQQWITGKQWTDYVSFDPRLPDNAALVIIRVPRDQRTIDILATRVQQFLTEVDEEVKFVKNYGKEIPNDPAPKNT